MIEKGSGEMIFDRNFLKMLERKLCRVFLCTFYIYIYIYINVDLILKTSPRRKNSKHFNIRGTRSETQYAFQSIKINRRTSKYFRTVSNSFEKSFSTRNRSFAENIDQESRKSSLRYRDKKLKLQCNINPSFQNE